VTCQLPGRLAPPAQRRPRVSTGFGIDQPVQRLDQVRIGVPQPLGPPPGRRMRPCGSGGSFSSPIPSSTIGRGIPLRRAIRAPPPRPSVRAPALSRRRRCRSFRCGEIRPNSVAGMVSKPIRGEPTSAVNPPGKQRPK
jgi:hypothetical protein